MAFKGITFAGQNVTPKNDGALYGAHYGDGILDGCTMTISGDDLVIASGHIIAGGRVCQVDGATSVDLSGRTLTTGYIQVVMNYDLTQSEGSQWYTTFVESATTTFPDLTQDDINGTGTLYQKQLAIVQVSGGNLTNITGLLLLSPIVALRGMIIGDGSINPRIDFYDENGDFGGTLLFNSTGNADFRINGSYNNADTSGMWMEQGGRLILFGKGNNIVLRPNGASSTSGQVTLDASGQLSGGHSQIFQYGTKAVSATTDTQIFTFTISESGLYIISVFMDSNASNTGVYNNQLVISSSSVNRVVRTPMTNGGGSCFCGIYNIGTNATVEVRGYAPAACTLRATVTASKLA